MSRKSFIAPAFSGAFIASAALITGAAATALAGGSAAQPARAAAAPAVTIRIEGAQRTLLATTRIAVPSSGYITAHGASSHGCPAASAAGVLDAATHHHWSGTWEGNSSAKINDYFVTNILGETESGAKAYFEILVNNVPAATGPCEIKLKPGDQLLFGTVSLSGKGEALVIRAPRSATRGHALKVTVEAVNGKGKATPLAKATVTAGGSTATTNAHGVATFTPRRAGTLTLGASAPGEIRAATVAVRVWP